MEIRLQVQKGDLEKFVKGLSVDVPNKTYQQALEAAEQIKQYFLGQFEANYNSGGSLYGGWAELSEDTHEVRRKQGYGAFGGQKLVRSGNLRQAVLNMGEIEAKPNEIDVIFAMEHQSVTYPYDSRTRDILDVFYNHQYGGNIPARTMVAVVPEDINNIMEIFDGRFN